MTSWLIGIAAWVVVSFPLGVLIGRGIHGYASGCSCRKHAWDPGCPVHGRNCA